MRSNRAKVLHELAGKPMISHVVEAVRSSAVTHTVVVVGRQADEVKEFLAGRDLRFALQEPQLGTGHAVAAAGKFFENHQGDVLIVCGDTPLLEPQTIDGLIESHARSNSRLTVLTTRPPNPAGYGRIVRNESDEVVRIVEEVDLGPEEKGIAEVNTGVYLVDSTLLFSLLERIEPDNAQGEYYLTDIVREAVNDGIPVHGFILENSIEVTGINSRRDLAAAAKIIRTRINERLMDAGVTLIDPESVYVDHGVEVGADTVIHPGATIVGNTRIGEECVIEPGVLIRDSLMRDRVRVLLGSRIDSAEIEEGSQIGPMANLRPESKIGKNVRVGNFVEVKKSVLGDGTKASHLTYLGDSTIGRDVNVGCGTITCNYDGTHKHPTIIHDRCFIGSDVQFVAPVEIGEGSLIGAGSTITRDVPPNTLAVSRVRQKNLPLRTNQGPESSDEDRRP
jgi:bifunctional UDP-N-acetylglucosamine pyrophosphorylase/glucosamine-1-phosphate N-acetyltransferase